MKRPELPHSPGVYMFVNNNKEVIYVGKAIDLKNRVSSYFNPSLLSPKTKQMVANHSSIKYIRTTSEFDALLLEAKLIKSFKPKYNVIWRDDKHPLYIKITGGTYPKVTTSRKEDDKASVYFGPFPSSRIVKETLRFLREIVPYCIERTVRQKPCFYAHIGLCHPCPNEIEQQPTSIKKQLQKEYRSHIRRLVRILQGKSSAVISELMKDMQIASDKEDYRTAQHIKDAREKLTYLTEKRRSIHEYLKNPNLYSDVRIEECERIAQIAGAAGASRIEGYDISNTMGTNATGSMVVFQDGDPDTSSYRRFKIRTKNAPDDYAMMREMIRRRLRHEEWPRPDIMLIDGGIGHVSTVLDVLEQERITIPTIGLAKQLEEIIVPTTSGGERTFQKVRLPMGSPALRIVQRIRDEAHRFAKTYHIKLRAKSMLY